MAGDRCNALSDRRQPAALAESHKLVIFHQHIIECIA